MICMFIDYIHLLHLIYSLKDFKGKSLSIWFECITLAKDGCIMPVISETSGSVKEIVLSPFNKQDLSLMSISKY